MSLKELVRENPVRNAQGWCLAQGQGTSSMTQCGATAPGTTGTLTVATVSLTNAQTRARRNEYLVTTASTSAVAGQRNATQHLTPGNGSGAGGFRSTMLGGPATGVATASHRFFMGLRASGSAPTDVDPSTLALIVGVGYDDTDTNVQIMHNDGSGTASKVDTGWAVPTTDREAWYMLELVANALDTNIRYKLTDMNTMNVVHGLLTTNIPAYGNFLAERTHASAGGTSSVIGVACGGHWFEGE